jgi:hypothetical protein
MSISAAVVRRWGESTTETVEKNDMQFLISVIDTETGMATETEMAAIDEFNEQLKADGHWVLARGLAAPASSTLIDNRGGAGLITAGPFIESSEYISGLWIIDAPDAVRARELAIEGSRCCNRRVELRQLLGD